MIIVLVALSVGLISTLVNVCRSSKRLSKATVNFLYSLVTPTIVTYVILFSKVRIQTFIAYHVYAIGMLWMHIALLNFVYEYWGERFSRKRLRKVVFPIAIIDTVSLCVNIFTQHMFSMLYVPWKSVPYQFQPHFFIVLHFAFLMFLISAAFIHYLSNFITCSRLYAERYIVLFCGLSVIVLAELYSLIMHPASDCVIMAYIGYGILVALYSTFQERSQVTNRMLSQVVSQISDAVVFLDVNGDCVYINDSAARLLNVTQKELKLAKNKLIRFMESDEQWSTETYKRTRNFIQDSVEYSYETEFHRVYDSNGVYSGGFICIRDRSEDARRINREAYIASHDRLTGLYNRDYLCRRIEQRLQEDPDTEYLIICSDILEFKLVNDIFGKKIGDQILVNTARLMDSLRRPDVLYGRVGGDRFAVMMPKERYNEARFVAGAGDYSQINGEIFYPATIQFGVYEVSDRTLPASIMFDRAFMAIESIKNDLQRRIAYYTDDMRNILLWEQQLTSQLDTAMRDNLIIPYLQPQVDTDGKVEGAEVLCRWDHTPQGIMVPENFIGILERNGMIVKLDYFMWESACKILKKWSLNGKGNFYLSVNISPKDFYFIDVYETIIGLVEKYGIEPERLRLEITETVMMTDSKNKFQLIDRLREHGFIVEMDDFGSGYSSLNMLKDLPVDIIKFDMLFLSHTEHSDRARTILRHLFAMANQLEIPVITEGVETQEQANFLAELGCNMFQGFFFSKPITLEAFEKTYF